MWTNYLPFARQLSIKNLATDLSTTLEWNTNLIGAMRRVDLAKTRGLIKREQTKLHLKIVYTLSLILLDLYQAIGTNRF